MDGLAATAGLRENDEIIAVDGQPVTTWSETFSRLVRRVGDTGAIQLDVKRHDSQNTFAERSLLLPIEHWLGDTQEPDFFHVLGIVRYMPDTEPVIQQVIANSAAALAGLQAQDRIVSVDGEPVLTWMQWVTYVRSKPESTMTLQVKRGEQLLAIALTPSSASESGQLVGKAGVTASITWPESMIRPIEYTLLGAVNNGIEKTWEQSTFILSFIKKLILAEVSTKNLSGSFTIAQVAGDSANAGLASYLAFLAFLSVSLGVFNLMPIPVLDGGHLLYYVIEVIKGSPVSEKIQVIGYQFGLFFVLSIMVVAHVNDLVRIFS
jgi:regulator of sigma E protease